MYPSVEAQEPLAPLRGAFELLFGLLRYIDECNDDVIFFADEGGAWQVDVDWRTALPAYFRCLADTASPDEFAHEVDGTIRDFAEYKRPRHLTAARRITSAEQKAALRRHGRKDLDREPSHADRGDSERSAKR